MRIVRGRLEEDLRHRRGLVYAVDFGGGLVASDTVHVGLWLDPKRKDVPVVAHQTLASLRRLAEEAPGADELKHDLEGFVEVCADPRSVVDHLESCALAILSGEPPTTVAQLLEERRAVTADAVRQAFAVAVPSLLLLVPEELDPFKGMAQVDLPEIPDSVVAPVEGRAVKRRLISSAPFGARLTVSDEGISLTFDHRTDTVRFADAVGVARYPDGYLRLVGLEGGGIPLAAKDWKDGSDVIALVRRCVPASLWYDAEPGPDE
jgi:hypothetical protein